MNGYNNSQPPPPGTHRMVVVPPPPVSQLQDDAPDNAPDDATDSEDGWPITKLGGHVVGRMPPHDMAEIARSTPPEPRNITEAISQTPFVSITPFPFSERGSSRTERTYG